MDNHPIPQDVTGFQFKLIGNMTVKQFGYVVVGVILAVIIYSLPLQSALGILIKAIFVPLLGGSGFLIAFLPIEGRPVDVMFGNFMKALFSPNQFVYQKTGRLFSFSTIQAPMLPTQRPHTEVRKTTPNEDKTNRLSKLLQTTHVQKQTALDKKEAAFLESLSSFAPATPALQTQPVQQAPSLQQIAPQTPVTSNVLAQQEQVLNQQLQKAKQEEMEEVKQARGATSEAHEKALTLERQVQTLHFQRQQLEEQLAHLQKQLVDQKAAVVPQPVASTPMAAPVQATAPAPVAAQPQPLPAQQPAPAQQAQTLLQEATKRVGLPHTPDTPNVIAGVVKDPRGNVLPNILVEVKDKDGNPVRAFKTNTLGQFASATPLTPGNYTVELEDPKKLNTFAVIQLAATNQILLPIEIISHDAREELRKQLFN